MIEIMSYVLYGLCLVLYWFVLLCVDQKFLAHCAQGGYNGRRRIWRQRKSGETGS